MRYDTLIIGAGLSGLAAGIRLALFDRKVAVLEQHNVWGGLNSFYGMQGRKLDVGLHALTNFIPPPPHRAPGVPLARILRQLRLDRAVEVRLGGRLVGLVGPANVAVVLRGAPIGSARSEEQGEEDEPHHLQDAVGRPQWLLPFRHNYPDQRAGFVVAPHQALPDVRTSVATPVFGSIV